MQKQLATIFFFLLTTFCVAQNPITYTTKDGLPSNLVYDIVQDKDGFMWFATNRGVAKFDGDTFKAFTMKDGLPNNDTWKLEADLQGRLWYISKSKYQGYIKNDSVYKFKTEDNKVLSPQTIKTESGLLYLDSKAYEVKGQQLKEKFSYAGVDSLYRISSTNKVISNYTYFVNDSTTVHISPKKITLFDEKLNPIYEKLVSIPKASKLLDLRFSTSYGYNTTAVWLTETSIVFFNKITKEHKIIILSKNEAKSLKKNSHCRIMFLPEEIQIKAEVNLFRYDYNFNKIEHIILPENNINAAYLDSFGNLWTANETGVQFTAATQRIAAIHLATKNIQRLGSIDNVLYAGERKAGFYAFDGHKFPKEPTLVGSGEIYNIKEARNSAINFLNLGGASYKKNVKSFELIDISKMTNYGILYNDISFKTIEFFNNQYQAIYPTGILSIDSDFTSFELGIYRSGLFDFEALDNKLYAGANDGLYQYLNKTLLKIAPNNEIAAASILVMNTYQDRVFIGTDGRGVYTYNGNKIEHLKTTDELSIQEILKEKDTLWLATQNGVKKVLLKSRKLEESTIIDQFVEADGIFDNNINDIYKKNNQLFVATDRGVSELDLTAPEYSSTPKVYFKTKNDTLLTYTYSKEEDITIDFGAIAFGNTDNISFEYRLQPNQKQWTTSPSRSVTFSNLSPGNHTLEIKGTNQHYKTGNAALSIQIKPLWWQTNLAIGIFWFLGVLGLIGFAYIIKKSIQKSESVKNVREKQIAGLELQALRSQMNPHFVHNSLNAIQYYIQRNEVELSENYLSKFSKLIRLFFEYSRKQSISLSEEVLLLNHYLEIEKMRFEEKLSYNVHIDPEMDLDEYHIPSMILQPIVENAVNHGIFHKTSNGTIDLHFKKLREENSFSISIEDDGIGVEKAKNLFKTSSKNYQSRSSAVLAERLQLLEQSDDWKITYNIEDLSTHSNMTGTRVLLTFKKLYNA